METLWQDIRFASRNLARTRGLTTVAVLTLALGIGANTAIFSVIYAVLLRPLPFRDPGELVQLYETEAAPGNYPLTGPDFFDWKQQNHTFQDMALYSWPQDLNLSDEGRAERVVGTSTEWNFFALLGTPPALGRTFVQGEDEPGKPKVCILSYGLWKSHFGGDPGILQKSIELNAQKYTVIGVMPASFRFPSVAQLWVPQPMDLQTLGPRGSHSWRAIGRLKRGVTVQQARAEISLIASRLEQQYPDSNHKVNARVFALQDDLVRRSRDQLMMMLWAVALVLLIACANVANLLLSRSVARQKEMAIRAALGAPRTRLIRQLLTESVLLGVVGGGLGLLLATGGVRYLASVKSFGIPRVNTIELNLPVLAFTFGIALLTGLVFGLFPAIQISRPDLHDELKGGAGSSVSPTHARRATSNLLVISEVGLSLLLLICSALLLKDFLQLRNSDVGVRREGMWTGAVRLPSSRYKSVASQAEFAQALLARVRQIPGIESAALSTRLPLNGGSNYYAKIRGKVNESMGGPLVEVHDVTPGYFHTMGIPLLQGRDFTEQDVQSSVKLVERSEELYEKFKQGIKPPEAETDAMVYPSVINQAMVKAFWPNENPIGKYYSHGDDHGPWRQVIGVVGDVKQWGLAQPAQPEGYDPLVGDSNLYVVAHTSVDPAGITSAVREAVKQSDSSLPLFDVRTMTEVIADDAAGQEFASMLLAIFATLALVLAAIGIYGVLSYAVTQRTREIGIRMSLGATGGDVLRLVLAQGMKLAVAGFVVGIIGALAARKVLASSMVVSKPNDPWIYAAMPFVLAIVALLACYIPASRAAKVDPVIALRYE